MKRPTVFITYSESPFEFYIGFRNFQPLLPENLWKYLPFLWHIFKLPATLYRLTKFYHLKIFTKTFLALSKSYQSISNFFNFVQNMRENSWKDLNFLWHIFKVPLNFYMRTKFYHKIFRKKNVICFNLLTKCYLF